MSPDLKARLRAAYVAELTGAAERGELANLGPGGGEPMRATVERHPARPGFTVHLEPRPSWAPLGRVGWFRRKADAKAHAARLDGTPSLAPVPCPRCGGLAARCADVGCDGTGGR